MRFEPSKVTEALEGRLKQLNVFIDGFELRGGIHRGYIRVFTSGLLLVLRHGALAKPESAFWHLK